MTWRILSRAAVRAASCAPALFSRRFAFGWLSAGLYGLSAVGYALLSHRAQSVLVSWASTNVHNLRTDPVGSLVASAFIPGKGAIGWFGLMILTMFTANKLLGNAGAAVLVASGHVLGTLVSEGVVAARVASGGLPAPAQLIVDVGPSYLVVCTLAATVLYGTWLYSIPAAVSFAAMAGDLFDGLSHLDVSAVGHLTALATGVIVGGLLLRRAHRWRCPPPGRPPVPRSHASPPAAGGPLPAGKG